MNHFEESRNKNIHSNWIVWLQSNKKTEPFLGEGENPNSIKAMLAKNS
jgi:hypothetical protein